MSPTDAVSKKTPREALDELKTLVDNLDKGKISTQCFTASIKKLIDWPFPYFPYAAENFERLGKQREETQELYAVFHLVACAIDVARQRDAISQVDNLLIHPLCHAVPIDKGKDLLLGYASDALTLALAYMTEKGICREPLGFSVEEKEEEE